ncbi:hypothetical protein BDA99DRAFT_529816 [Phascolomyces articulosus]|uniref:Uncharacterized protein n=1 Tax=Phascolomyces articulosus TaxID=60185 RepID=A0AAD5JKL9_9FUNG|nr:hypothetical protein BDA99DRAFT_529816 [Phascolomyces articulosus]
MTVAADNSVSIEMQWSVIPPPLNDVTNNTGLHDIEENNNNNTQTAQTILSSVQKNDDPTLDTAGIDGTSVMDRSLISNTASESNQSQNSLSSYLSGQLNDEEEYHHLNSNSIDTTVTEATMSQLSSLTKDEDSTKIPISSAVASVTSETTTLSSPTLIVAQTPQHQKKITCESTTVDAVPCKRTCEEPTIDYRNDTVVKRARADEFSPSSSSFMTQPKDWCRRCGTTETPRWRGGPLGRHTLCNACGLRWKNVGCPDEGYNSPTYPPPELPPNMRPKTSLPKLRAPKPKITRPTKETSPKISEMNNSKATETSSDTAQDIKHIIINTPGYDELPKIPNNVLLRKRKQFLIAGLYSPTYKEIQLPTKGISTKRPPRVSWKKGAFNSDGSSQFRLPLPIHQGEFLLNTECEFSLPADILQEHYGGCLRQISNYTKIKTNIYVGRRPCKTDHQAAKCQCEVPSDEKTPGCGDDCLNRMLFYECDPRTCPCEDKCTNRRFQQKKYITDLEPFPTTHRGWGLRTLVAISKGELVTEYRGEVITHQMVKERMNTIYKGQQNFYFLDYGNGEVIDAGLKGSEARFINHSCNPNCHIEKWGLKGELFVGVFASRDITAGEELFYDYNFSTFGESGDDQLCRCDSDICRGTIGKKRRENAM